MEKEEIDACSPNGVLEGFARSIESETLSSSFARSTESETLSSKASTSETEKDSKFTSRWAEFMLVVNNRTKRIASLSSSLNGFNLSRKFGRSFSQDVDTASSSFYGADLNYFKPQWKNFSLSQLKSATNNFSNDNLIGKGGYAEVYKGRLKDGRLVAVKQLKQGPHEERIGNFLSELGIMAHLNHPNTAKLIGYGVEGGLHLVLELSPHGSLASWLHVLKKDLEWSIRYKVALGVAEGLVYLHEGCQRRIIHRDIKAANILLTENFEPQICDFGLAKWLPEHWTHHTISKFEGTFGYLAPEFLMHGIVDEKTDVFAFGVLLLELISGRRALDYSQQSLVMWAKPLLKKNRIRELVDPMLADAYDILQMNLMVLAASLCLQHSSIRRPQMSQVLKLLKGYHGNVDIVMRKSRSTSSSCRKKYYEELFSSEAHCFADAKDSNGL